MEKIDFKYQIVNLIETSYRYNYDYSYDGLNKKDVIYRLANNIKINSDKEIISIEYTVRLEAPQHIILVEDSIVIDYNITPINEIILQMKHGKINTNIPQLISTFNNIAIGALRGILAKNLKSTPLEGCVIPLVQ